MVRTGAWNSALLFFPAMPPRTSNGDVTKLHIKTITTIVPKGSAAVAVYAIATVFRKQKVRKRGPQKRHPVNSRFLTCISKLKRSY